MLYSQLRLSYKAPLTISPMVGIPTPTGFENGVVILAHNGPQSRPDALPGPLYPQTQSRGYQREGMQCGTVLTSV